MNKPNNEKIDVNDLLKKASKTENLNTNEGLNDFIKNNKSTTNAYINPEQKEFNDLDRFYAN